MMECLVVCAVLFILLVLRVVIRLGFHQRLPLLFRRGIAVDRLLDFSARKYGARVLIELETPLRWKLPDTAPGAARELEWSAEKIRHAAGIIAGGLKRALLLEHNDRIAIFKRNHFDIFLFSSAITRAGAIAAPVNGGLAVDDFCSYLRYLGARALFTDTESVRRVHAEGGNLGCVELVIVSDSKGFLADGTPEEAVSWAQHGATQVYRSLEWLTSQTSEVEPASTRGADDPIYIVHTSGTTGFPKGVIVVKRGLTQSLRAAMLFNLVSRRDLSYFAIPFNHQVTHLYLNGLLAFGSRAILASEFDVRRTLGAIAERKVNVYFGFPITYTRMAAAIGGGHDLSSMRIWGATADASHEVHQRMFISQGSFFRALGLPVNGALFVDGLGSSEVGIAALLRISGPWTRDFGRRVGRPVPFFGPKVKVVDEKCRPVKTGEPGRLMIKGPCMFGGYWNAHDKLYGASRDGWWFTGDIMRQAPDGCYIHLDREVDVIRHREGVSYTLLMEEEILKHPAVYDATVFAWSGSGCGVSPAAAVALRDDWLDLSAEQLKKELNETLPAADRLANVTVMAWKEFPIGVTGKTLKRALREISSGRHA